MSSDGDLRPVVLLFIRASLLVPPRTRYRTQTRKSPSKLASSAFNLHVYLCMRVFIFIFITPQSPRSMASCDEYALTVDNGVDNITGEMFG